MMAMAMAEADLPLSPPASPGILEQALMNLDDIMVGDTLPPVPGPHYAAGWRRHRSERSGRYFYFNINTLESRWDLPLMGPEPNLGLGLPTNQVAPVVPERRSSSAPATPQPGVQLQRPSFPQTNPSVSAATRPTATRPTSAPAAAVTAPSTSTNSANATVVGSSAVPDADDRNVSGRFHLGGKRYVVVKRYKGQAYVNIREYYQPKDRETGRLFAGKRGINLTIDQWISLSKHTGALNRTLTAFAREKFRPTC